tara:strand:+ start:224 stop:379 length:156 start_codon:yes stop_codon:yes gene_type:complete
MKRDIFVLSQKRRVVTLGEDDKWNRRRAEGVVVVFRAVRMARVLSLIVFRR